MPTPATVTHGPVKQSRMPLSDLVGTTSSSRRGRNDFGDIVLIVRRNLRLVVEVAGGTGETLAAMKLNTLPYLPVMYVCSKQPD